VNMNAALRHSLIHEFMHATMMFSGFLFYWLVIDPKPHRSRLHYGLRVLYLGLIVIPNTLLGVALVFAESPLYSAYVEAGQLFGMSIMDDQVLGGLMLWVPGDMMSILTSGVVMILWYQKEQEQSAAEAAVREAEAKKL
jgi:putative membrane protein